MTFENFLLVFGRTAGLFLIAPVFSGRQVPIQLRIMFVLALAGIIAFVTPIKSAVLINNSGMFILALIFEMLIGYTLGFVMYIVFATVQLAGQFLDMQMGFGIVNVLDPLSGMQLPMMGNFQYLVALLVYLGINGHHLLIKALHNSYLLIPVMGADFNGQFTEFMLKLGGAMFVTAVKLAAPVVTAVFIADVALGFMARTVPQMNVFIVGLPLKILGGLFMFIVIMPIFIWFVQVLLERFFNNLDAVILLLGK